MHSVQFIYIYHHLPSYINLPDHCSWNVHNIGYTKRKNCFLFSWSLWNVHKINYRKRKYIFSCSSPWNVHRFQKKETFLLVAHHHEMYKKNHYRKRKYYSRSLTLLSIINWFNRNRTPSTLRWIRQCTCTHVQDLLRHLYTSLYQSNMTYFMLTRIYFHNRYVDSRETKIASSLSMEMHFLNCVLGCLSKQNSTRILFIYCTFNVLLWLHSSVVRLYSKAHKMGGCLPEDQPSLTYLHLQRKYSLWWLLILTFLNNIPVLENFPLRRCQKTTRVID